ncbi:MAG: hypothetical protein M0C28_27330 [Candidatus Moduliflexus flocculans]|nr:hypothetical protein [Candidatus Moduliflexus flocculans]
MALAGDAGRAPRPLSRRRRRGGRHDDRASGRPWPTGRPRAAARNSGRLRRSAAERPGRHRALLDAGPGPQEVQAEVAGTLEVDDLDLVPARSESDLARPLPSCRGRRRSPRPPGRPTESFEPSSEWR